MTDTWIIAACPDPNCEQYEDWPLQVETTEGTSRYQAINPRDGTCPKCGATADWISY